MRIIGYFGRLIFWIGLIYIVGHAAVNSFLANNYLLAVLELAFFPLTYLIYPWTVGLWWILLVSIVGYLLSTLFGMSPVD